MILRKSILIAPYGNSAKMLTESWLKYKEEREFDICLLFYHKEIERPENYKDVDYFFHLKGFKYKMIHDLLINLHPEWIEKYEYFYFIDDDVEMDTRKINQLFALAKAHNTWIAQASLSKDSYCSWPILKTDEKCFCRYMGQIEVMAPLFDRYALKICLEAESFIANDSSWGIDCAWSALLGYPSTKIVVFDIVTMKHTHPVGAGELYKKIGNPHEDWEIVVKKYGAEKMNYRELGRLMKVNPKVNRLMFMSYKLVERKNMFRQTYNDYDIGSRIKSRMRKLGQVFKIPARS